MAQNSNSYQYQGSSSSTYSGQLQANSIEQLEALLNQYPDNEQISAAYFGALIDNAVTQGNIGSNLQYEGAMGELQLQLTSALSELMTSQQMQLIDAEGQMASQLINDQFEGLGKLSTINSGLKINEINALGQNNLNSIWAQSAANINLANVNSANAIKQLGAAGDISKDLQEQKGRLDKELALVNGDISMNLINAKGQVDLNNIWASSSAKINEMNVGNQHAQQQISLTAEEKRKTDTNFLEVGGEQQRLTDTNRITTTGKEQRLTDTNRIKETGFQTRKNTRVEGEEKLKQINATGDQNVRLENTRGDNQRKNDANKREQEEMLRTDARGQTAKQGAKFFG